MTNSTSEIKVSISVFGKCATTALGSEAVVEYLGDILDRFKITPIGSADATHFISIDHDLKAFNRSRKIPINRRMLIIYEPEAVNPSQHKPKIRAKYGRIVIGSPLQMQSASEILIHHGYLNEDFMETWKAHKDSIRTDTVGVVNENKFSFVRGNNYKLRLTAIRGICESGKRVNLAGKNWDASRSWHLKRQINALYLCLRLGGRLDLSNWHFSFNHQNLHLSGWVHSDVSFLAKNEFALVIENDSNYVSEKLFNSLLAGCLPIYVGPSLDIFGIPTDLAIAVDRESKNFSQAIATLTPDQKKTIKQKGEDFLKSQIDLGSRWNSSSTKARIQEATIKFLRST